MQRLQRSSFGRSWAAVGFDDLAPGSSHLGRNAMDNGRTLATWSIRRLRSFLGPTLAEGCPDGCRLGQTIWHVRGLIQHGSTCFR